MLRGKENKIAYMKVVGTAVTLDTGGSCRIGLAYCFLCSRYAVLNSFKEVISGRNTETSGVKGDSTWFEALCEVKRENVVVACGEEL
jgi:hypothetical protein